MMEWKPIQGYEGFYEVSDTGLVRGLDRVVKKGNGTRKIRQRILKLGRVGRRRQYLEVKLGKYGEIERKKVHHLVYETFVGPRDLKLRIDHIDNNPLNNRINNLQQITNRENTSKDKKGTSNHTGVFWDKRLKKWRAGISINSRTKYLGSFSDEKKAALAYKNALKTLTKIKPDQP